MNAYLKIDSYILQDFAAANIRFSKRTGFKGLVI